MGSNKINKNKQAKEKLIIKILINIKGKRGEKQNRRKHKYKQ